MQQLKTENIELQASLSELTYFCNDYCCSHNDCYLCPHFNKKMKEIAIEKTRMCEIKRILTFIEKICVHIERICVHY